MKEKIKKYLLPMILLGAILLGGLLLLNASTLAHSGGTDAYGCHTCRTKCFSWGLSYGEYHCHQSKGLPQPENPIRSHYGSGGTGWTEPAPDYGIPDYSIPNYIPNCPFNSYYDSISDSCKCYSGYVVSGGECISMSQWCRDKYGLWATNDYLTDNCKCMSGYIFGKDFLGRTTCISADQYCRDRYGFNSRHNTLSDSCECSYGYVFDSNDQCVSKDDYCEDLYGYYAEYDILVDGCTCKDGYELKNSKCMEIVPIIYSFYPTTVKTGESVAISGNNFGDYKGDVILNTLSFGTLGRISSFNIKSWSDNKIKFIVPEGKEPDKYYIRVKPFLTFSSKEAVTSNKLEVLMPLSEIYSISPLEAGIGEEVTIRGENFGDSKYGDLNLYVGSIKVNSLDISKWQNSKIVFEVGDYLESGYITLKDGTINVWGSYLEILEPEENNTSSFYVPPEKKPISQQITTNESKPEPLQQGESEFQEEPRIIAEAEPKTESRIQEKPQIQKEPLKESEEKIEKPQEQNQQEISDEGMQEQKPRRAVSIFLASIFTAVKGFFSVIFHWFK